MQKGLQNEIAAKIGEPPRVLLRNMNRLYSIEWQVAAPMREHFVRSGWRLASFAVHSLFAPRRCRLGTSTLTVRPFNRIAHFATRPT
jgi:hypothetical protein